jgi:hypothetical protein
MTTTTVRTEDEIKYSGRTMTRTFHLDDTTVTDSRGTVYHPAVYVSASHDKDRKHYRVSFHRVYIGGYVWGMAIDFYKGDEKPHGDFAVPAARHSAKALEAAFNEGVAVFEANREAFLAWAPGALKDAV